MARRYDAVDLTRSFVVSANKLCKGQPHHALDIDATLNQLLIHPDAPGLRREPIQSTQIGELWSLRVSKGIRLLEQEPPGPRARALRVGAHDATYRWAQRYRGGGADEVVGRRDRQPLSSGAAEGLAPVTQSPSPPRAESAGIDRALFQYLPAAHPPETDMNCVPLDSLRDLGLAAGDADRIRQASPDVLLSNFGVDPVLADAILDLYLQCLPSTEPSALPAQVENPPASLDQDAVSSTVPLPVPRDRDLDVASITAPGQFLRMVDLGLDRYLTNITDDQRALAHMEQHGLLVIRGCGGSGKTTVAVHRARYLGDAILRQPQLYSTGPRRVIYLCFNRTLAHIARKMLVTLYGRKPSAHVEALNLDAWARRYLEWRGILPGAHNLSGSSTHRVAPPSLAGFIAHEVNRLRQGAAQQRSVAARLAPELVYAEIADMIIGRDLRTVGEYLNADRAGRTSGLREAERRLIWDIFESRRELLAQQRQVDIEMLAALALRELRSDATFIPYEAVIVDEAQDLRPIGLQLATQMAGQDLNRVTICADAAQSIYRSGFRWQQAELNPRGRQLRTLDRNHRNTAQIHDAATALLARGAEPEEPDTYVSAQRPDATGPLPIVLVCDDTNSELHAMVLAIRKQLDEGVAPQTIGVLAGTNTRMRETAQRLADSGIPTEMANEYGKIRITHRSVKLLTMHNAKGLDFPHVYLVGLTEDGLPGRRAANGDGGADRHALDAQRRLLYTAMIRAGHTLVMTTIAGKEHPLLADLSEEVCERKRTESR